MVFDVDKFLKTDHGNTDYGYFVTSDDVNDIILHIINNDNYEIDNIICVNYIKNVKLIHEILEALINAKYTMTPENYKTIMSCVSYIHHNGGITYESKDKEYMFNSHLIFKNFNITDDELQSYIDFAKTENIQRFNIMFTSIDPCNKTTLKNILYLLISICDVNGVKSLQKVHNISITSKCLKYNNNDTYDYMINYLKNQINDGQLNNLSCYNKLFNCANFQEIDDYLYETNTNVTPQIIIDACAYGFEFNSICHLFTYKLEFDCDSVNNIIDGYKNNSKLQQLLLMIQQCNYQFVKSNYIRMFSSPYYFLLFDKKITDNFTFDDDITLSAYNCIEKHEEYWNKNKIELATLLADNFSFHVPEFIEFLKNIKYLCENNPINTEGYVALQCAIGKLDETKKFIADTNFVLTPKCLLYLYKKKSNANANAIRMFKKDNVKADYEVYKQFADTFVPRKEQKYLFDLDTIV